MVCFKGDPPRQLSDRTWIHWCREVRHTIMNIGLDYCDHCHDPSPMKQAEIHEQQIAMLAGEWCDVHNKKLTTYIDGRKDCGHCLANAQVDNPHPTSPHAGMY